MIHGVLNVQRPLGIVDALVKNGAGETGEAGGDATRASAGVENIKAIIIEMLRTEKNVEGLVQRRQIV
jgi:hypothetical protein